MTTYQHDVLMAREATLASVSVECESEADKGRSLLLLMLREAIGVGFDAGVKYTADQLKADAK